MNYYQKSKGKASERTKKRKEERNKVGKVWNSQKLGTRINSPTLRPPQ